jgi:hypothetical protein
MSNSGAAQSFAKHAKKWKRLSATFSRRLPKSPAIRAAENIRKRAMHFALNSNATGRASFIPVRFAEWNTKHRFSSTEQAIICARA